MKRYCTSDTESTFLEINMLKGPVQWPPVQSACWYSVCVLFPLELMSCVLLVLWVASLYEVGCLAISPVLPPYSPEWIH